MKRWLVKYIDIEALRSRKPFHKREEVVEAESRHEAMEFMRNKWPRPKYEVKSASIIQQAQQGGKE